MPVNDLAEQIRTDVNGRLAAAGDGAAVEEEHRLRVEGEVRRDALRQIRCHELWVLDGRQPGADFGQYLNQAGQAMYTTKQGTQYRADVTVNTKEALGFLKDWSTSLIQLDTAAIGAIGLFVGFGDFARSTILNIWRSSNSAQVIGVLELTCIGLSTVSFFSSLVFGLFLLNALPGAAQRVPVNALAMQNDVFAIANIGREGQVPVVGQGPVYRHFARHLTIGTMSRGLRVLFLSGAFFFAAFIILGLWRTALTASS
jgi:hypothetical protein